MNQLEKDEIEDVTDEMLDRLIKEGKTLAVLFCKFGSIVSLNHLCCSFPNQEWNTTNEDRNFCHLGELKYCCSLSKNKCG